MEVMNNNIGYYVAVNGLMICLTLISISTALWFILAELKRINKH